MAAPDIGGLPEPRIGKTFQSILIAIEDRMKRRSFIQGLLTVAVLDLGFAGMAKAEPLTDEVIRTLQRSGYGNIQVQRTWLGRLRAIGSNGSKTREIIVNGRTGEVLRDVVISRDASGNATSGYSDSNDDHEDDGRDDSRNDDRDDRDDDDKDDDRDDDDRDDDDRDDDGSDDDHDDDSSDDD
jgi:hypothetical protein